MSRTAADSDAIDALQTTLARFWPGARTELVRSRRDCPGADAEFLVLPDSRRPRLLLPVSPRAAAASVMRFSATAGPVEIAARTLASAALRGGATRALPERIRVYADPTAGVQPLVDALGAALGVSGTTFSLGIGPARVNRKPVLQVFDPEGRSVGFAKLGDSDQARTHVRAEAEALTRLAQERFSHFRVPELLHLGRWQDLLVLVQEDLSVGPRALLRRRTSPQAAMEELTRAFAGPDRPMPDLAWWQRCRDRAAEAPDRQAADRLGAAMDDLARQHPGPVPVSAWHGDWTPWNMAPGRTATGASGLLVWDWERFETDVPAGLDTLHHAVNTATLTHGATPAVVRRALAEAGAAAAPGTPGHAAGAAYLVAVTARYLQMSAAPGGELIVPRALTCLETLEDWLSV